MNSRQTRPQHFRLNTLLALGVSQIDELARKAVGTLTSYRLVLGRCLLALRESKGFKTYGCSSEIHYAVSRLGVSRSVATECRRVARDLIPLPELTLAAELGTIEWGKLREISRKASPETEALWLELSKKMNYHPVQKLVGKTPKGALPGDVFEEPERPTTELRCEVSEVVLAMVDRARRLYSLEQDRAVTTAQVLEWALASYIANQPVDEENLEKVRQDMDKDLQAQKAREIPLVAEAREVAARMGFIPVELEETVEEPARAGHPNGGCSCCETDEHSGAKASLNTFGDASLSGLNGTSSLNELLEQEDFNQTPRTGQNLTPDNLTEALIGTLSLELAKATLPAGLDSPSIDLPPLQNTRLCFNPLNRHATKAQKKEVLRRESWCCASPGCPHRIFLHLHHLIPFSQGGPTLARNLLGICSSCHTNVHEGSLRIFLSKDGKLKFTDANGSSLSKQADLELAGWLDFHQGWEGAEEDSHQLRARSGDWAVFDG